MLKFRTFPGQSYCWSCCTPASVSAGFGRPPLCRRFEKVIRQQRNVILPFPERRNFDREHAEPIKQILSKPARFRFGSQVAIRGRH